MKDFKVEVSFYKNGKKYAQAFPVGEDVLRKLCTKDTKTEQIFLNDFVYFLKKGQATKLLS